MIDRVKIFGERNSGTNYVAQLLEINFPIKILSGSPPYWWERRFGLGNLSMSGYFFLTGSSNLGWKHAVPTLRQAQLNDNVFVILTKNPYSWLLSLHKRPYHNWQAREIPFSEFIREPWSVMACEGLQGMVSTPVDLWNRKHGAYLMLAKNARFGIVSRYEDILADPENFLLKFSKVSNLSINNHVKFITHGAKSKDREKSSDYYKRYYLDEMWKNKLTTSDITYINQSLDAVIVNELGYTMIPSE